MIDYRGNRRVTALKVIDAFLDQHHLRMYGVEHGGQTNDSARASPAGCRRLSPATRVDDNDRLRGVSRREQLTQVFRIALRKNSGCSLALGNAVPKRHEPCGDEVRR